MKVSSAVAASRIPTDKSTISEELSVKCEVDSSDRERGNNKTIMTLFFTEVSVSVGVVAFKAAWHVAPQVVIVLAESSVCKSFFLLVIEHAFNGLH